AREELRACIEAATFEPPSGATVIDETTPDEAADHVASSGGSIHVVESDAAGARPVRGVRGGRVDGGGSAGGDGTRRALHGAGGTIATCYDGYVDRSASHTGTVHVSFTVGDGGRVTAATVERGGFDAALHQCVARAIRTIVVHGAHGRSVYAYEIAIGN